MMRKLFLLITSFFSVQPTIVHAAFTSPVVMELFTSQGCSSCPAADRLAAELADTPNLLVLSYHVSYWNYLGWDDPYSSDAATKRQYAYARTLQARGVYTPQALVQGQYDAVGSRKGQLTEALNKASEKGQWIKAELARNNGKLEIRLPQTNAVTAELFLVSYDLRHENPVTRGENAGRTLIHRNSVREIRPLGEWNGKAETLTQALPKADGVALLIQTPDHGPILGGAWF